MWAGRTGRSAVEPGDGEHAFQGRVGQASDAEGSDLDGRNVRTDIAAAWSVADADESGDDGGTLPGAGP